MPVPLPPAPRRADPAPRGRSRLRRNSDSSRPTRKTPKRRGYLAAQKNKLLSRPARRTVRRRINVPRNLHGDPGEDRKDSRYAIALRTRRHRTMLATHRGAFGLSQKPHNLFAISTLKNLASDCRAYHT